MNSWIKSFWVLAIFIVAFCTVCFVVSYKKKIDTNWYALTQKGVKAERYYGTSLKSILLNGHVLQTTSNCDTCPFQVTFSNDFPYAFTVKAKSNLMHAETDKLLIRFQHDSWIRDLLLPTPEFTYKIVSGCDVVTKLVYSQVNAQVAINRKSTIYKKESIDINDIFTKLIHDSLDVWMLKQDTIPNREIEDNACTNLINALRYVEDGSASGFRPRAYTLERKDLDSREEISSYLKTVEALIRGILKDNKVGKQKLTIYVTGYADSTSFVNPIPLTTDLVIIDENWRTEKTENKESFIEFGRPIPVQHSQLMLDRASQKVITTQIASNDNCQLSAVRAYFVARELHGKMKAQIGTTKIRYFYKAGGILMDKDLSKNRKISISIQLDAVSG